MQRRPLIDSLVGFHRSRSFLSVLSPASQIGILRLQGCKLGFRLSIPPTQRRRQVSSGLGKGLNVSNRSTGCNQSSHQHNCDKLGVKETRFYQENIPCLFGESRRHYQWNLNWHVTSNYMLIELETFRFARHE
jgi:hypothetical protein